MPNVILRSSWVPKREFGNQEAKLRPLSACSISIKTAEGGGSPSFYFPAYSPEPGPCPARLNTSYFALD